MRKTLGIAVIVLIISIFGITVFNSKRDMYNLHKKFYGNNFYNQVEKIEEGRGTKVFYNSSDYFYTDFCSNSLTIENKIKIGDVLMKQDSVLEIFRKDTKILTTIVEKPSDSYSSYFLSQ